jgi:putative membrane protein insertion efficiency factor
MKSIDKFFASLVISLIKNVYQKFISPILGKRLNVICRFYPSCSEYSILAFNKYGFLKGLSKTINRIKRCKPDNYDDCFDLP